MIYQKSFLATSLNSLKSTGTGANLSLSSLSISVFRLAKFVFSAKCEVSMCITFLDHFLVHSLKHQLSH